MTVDEEKKHVFSGQNRSHRIRTLLLPSSSLRKLLSDTWNGNRWNQPGNLKGYLAHEASPSLLR
jgi:hypothetical protein